MFSSSARGEWGHALPIQLLDIVESEQCHLLVGQTGDKENVIKTKRAEAANLTHRNKVRAQRSLLSVSKVFCHPPQPLLSASDKARYTNGFLHSLSTPEQMAVWQIVGSPELGLEGKPVGWKP